VKRSSKIRTRRLAEGRLVVDEIEDAKFPSFYKAQQLSIRSTHLIETKHVENTGFRERPETALGTVDRMIFFNDLQIGHLSKEQEVASDGAATIGAGGTALWKPGELSSSILTTFFAELIAIHSHPSDFNRVRNTNRATTTCTFQQFLRVGVTARWRRPTSATVWF